MALCDKNPPSSAGDVRDVALIPGLGRFSGEGNGNPLQYSSQVCCMKSRGRQGVGQDRSELGWMDCTL